MWFLPIKSTDPAEGLDYKANIEVKGLVENHTGVTSLNEEPEE